MTIDEVRRLGRLIDLELVHADSEGELYLELNTKYSPNNWSLLHAPMWVGDKLVAVVAKPRED